MAMIDYGAVVKKNGKLLPFNGLFNNYSNLSCGVLNDKGEYDGDESIRDNAYGKPKSIIQNFMSVVGDKDYLIATYKGYLGIFNSIKQLPIEYCIGLDDIYSTYHTHHKIVKKLETPFGTIKIKKLHPCCCAIASFWYKDDYYEILFGYGIDNKEFIMSNKANGYFGNAKVLRKIRRWYLK